MEHFLVREALKNVRGTTTRQCRKRLFDLQLHSLRTYTCMHALHMDVRVRLQIRCRLPIWPTSSEPELYLHAQLSRTVKSLELAYDTVTLSMRACGVVAQVATLLASLDFSVVSFAVHMYCRPPLCACMCKIKPYAGPARTFTGTKSCMSNTITNIKRKAVISPVNACKSQK